MHRPLLRSTSVCSNKIARGLMDTRFTVAHRFKRCFLMLSVLRWQHLADTFIRSDLPPFCSAVASSGDSRYMHKNKQKVILSSCRVLQQKVLRGLSGRASTHEKILFTAGGNLRNAGVRSERTGSQPWQETRRIKKGFRALSQSLYISSEGEGKCDGLTEGVEQK